LCPEGIFSAFTQKLKFKENRSKTLGFPLPNKNHHFKGKLETKFVLFDEKKKDFVGKKMKID